MTPSRSTLRALSVAVLAVASAAPSVGAVDDASHGEAAPTDGTVSAPAGDAAATPETAIAERGTLSIAVERAARVEPARTEPIRLELESFGGPVTVKDIVRRSGPVRQGDMIAVLEGKDFERSLEDLRTAVEESRRRLAMQREERAMQAKQAATGVERAELAAQLAMQALELHREYESGKSLELADLNLKSSMDSLRDNRDELAQLEKMYAGTSLQSETKDIVLERARRGVERGEVYAKYARKDNEIFKSIRHPNESRRVEDQARDAGLSLEAAQLGQRLGEIRAALDMAQAERGLRDLERRLERMEEDARRLTVKAPRDGYAVVKLREAGDQCQPRQEIAEVVDLGQLRVRGTMDARAMRVVQVGDVLDVWFPVRPESRAKAVVEELVAVGQPDGEGASFAFVAALRDLEGPVMPGIEARVQVRGELTDRVLVPTAAVKTEKGRSVVRVVGDAGEVEREVRVGADDGNRIEVLAGLAAGERVVTAATAGKTSDG